jgi:hypothetical protein
MLQGYFLHAAYLPSSRHRHGAQDVSMRTRGASTTIVRIFCCIQPSTPLCLCLCSQVFGEPGLKTHSPSQAGGRRRYSILCGQFQAPVCSFPIPACDLGLARSRRIYCQVLIHQCSNIYLLLYPIRLVMGERRRLTRRRSQTFH